LKKKPNHLNFKDDPVRFPANPVAGWGMPSPAAATISASELLIVPDGKISSVYLKSIKKNGAGVNPNSVSSLAGVDYNYLKY